MNPLNQCTCTMKWPHKVLLPHAALRVLYVVVKSVSYTHLTGEILLQLLEGRLDNIVFRLGIAPTRAAARLSLIHICNQEAGENLFSGFASIYRL